ncbi:MAG: hypothetical protein AAFU54_01035 [Chloroflexota bacterium]
MNKIVVAIISVIILSSLLGSAAFASYRGYGLSTANNQTSARSGSMGGIWIIGGGPGGGGK